MRNFQGIVFAWTQTYRETFKCALVYLQERGKIQFEALENADIYKRFYSELAADLQEKLPKIRNKFTSQTTKNYYAKTLCNVFNDI